MRRKLTNIILDIAIDKGLKEIRVNSKRGIRNLVDLGAHFAKGRFQVDFYKMAQRMLEFEDSSYYDLIFKTVNNVNNNILKEFGINIGLNSWTYGANTIRNFEKDNGYNIPWTIIFDFVTPTKNPMELLDLLDIITQGKEVGIYTYMIFIDKDFNGKEDLFKVINDNSDCAFLLFGTPNSIVERDIVRIKECNNLSISIYMDNIDEEFLSIIGLLKENKCLYGIYNYYKDENVDEILSNNWIEKVIKLNCTYAFLISSNDCNKQNIKKVSSYIRETKTNQKYPIFLMDFFEDIKYVDGIISVEPCFVGFLYDGRVILNDADNYSELSFKKVNLKEILSISMPKVGYLK